MPYGGQQHEASTTPLDSHPRATTHSYERRSRTHHSGQSVAGFTCVYTTRATRRRSGSTASRRRARSGESPASAKRGVKRRGTGNSHHMDGDTTVDLRQFVLDRLDEDEARAERGELPMLDEAERR